MDRTPSRRPQSARARPSTPSRRAPSAPRPGGRQPPRRRTPGRMSRRQSESTPSLSPPVTSTRPSASATEAAPVGMAPTSPAATHVPLATCGTSARRTSHEEPSTATIRSAATDVMRLLERVTVEEIFISSCCSCCDSSAPLLAAPASAIVRYSALHGRSSRPGCRGQGDP